MAKADGFLEKGLSDEGKKGTFIELKDRAPYRPENLKMSKAEFIESEQKRKDKAKSMKAYSKKYDREQAIDPDKALDAVEAKASEVVEESQVELSAVGESATVKAAAAKKAATAKKSAETRARNKQAKEDAKA